jgi:uncharacterized protein (DUF885 family)
MTTFLAIALLVAPAAQRLSAISEGYWQHELERDVGLRVKYGLPVERLPEVSERDEEAEAAFARQVLERLRDLEGEPLPPEDALTRDILRWKAGNTAGAARFYWLAFPVTPYSSPLTAVNRVFTTFRFQQPADFDRYLSLLAAYPAFVDQMRAKLEGQRMRGILLPKDEIDLVIPFLAAAGKRGDESALFVKSDRLAALDREAARSFQDRLRAAVDTKVAPAFDRLQALLGPDYRAQAPAAVGLGQYPGGKDAYRFLVRFHTTMEVSPEEVHRTGLEEVASLDARMKQVRDSLGFRGDKAEFHRFLKTDPRFFAKTPEEVGERLRAAVRAIEPRLDAFFLRRPKAPYDVRRLDPALEGSMTYGYYQVPTAADPKGYYNYNGSNLSDRSLVNAAALAYHELVPGHHFQINLQSENEALPSFRRESYDTAFTEGWGTYSADLAEEMGLYRDPYDLYGRLLMDMFLATRLVVDTGMNDLGWPRERAIAFMKENTQESDLQIGTETLRYSVDMPGQALAYRMGARRLLELRERARKALGGRFDIRRFHDAVLGSGSMPMAVLERRVDRFIEDERAR